MSSNNTNLLSSSSVGQKSDNIFYGGSKRKICFFELIGLRCLVLLAWLSVIAPPVTHDHPIPLLMAFCHLPSHHGKSDLPHLMYHWPSLLPFSSTFKEWLDWVDNPGQIPLSGIFILIPPAKFSLTSQVAYSQGLDIFGWGEQYSVHCMENEFKNLACENIFLK